MEIMVVAYFVIIIIFAIYLSSLYLRDRNSYMKIACQRLFTTIQCMENEIVEKPDYVEELVNLIRSGEPDEGISEKIDNYHDNDIASALDELNEKER